MQFSLGRSKKPVINRISHEIRICAVQPARVRLRVLDADYPPEGGRSGDIVAEGGQEERAESLFSENENSLEIILNKIINKQSSSDGAAGRCVEKEREGSEVREQVVRVFQDCGPP